MTVEDISDFTTFENNVVKSDIPIFIDFYANWCGPCTALSPTIEELAKDYKGKVKFVKVNVDKGQGLALHYGVSSIPALFLVHNGKTIASRTGGASKEVFKEFIDNAIGKI